MQTKAIWVSLVILCIATPAISEECNKPLKLVGTLPMTQWGDGPQMTIPVSINGVEKQFLLDTGGFSTQISSSIADELKIPQRQAAIGMPAGDGTPSRNQVIIHDFAIGPLHTENYQIWVSPFAMSEGLFTPIGLKNLDFDIDFGAAKLKIFLSDHCEGHVFYWPHQAAAVVPFINPEVGDTSIGVRAPVGLITVPAILDGKEVKAIIDTGAPTSTLGMVGAMFTFGLRPDSPNMTKIGHIGNNENAPIFAYPFKTLTFGDVTVSNPHIRIYSEAIFSPDQKNDAPELKIGMDVLRKLHLYLALQEGKLYITEASAPATSSSAPSSSASADASK